MSTDSHPPFIIHPLNREEHYTQCLELQERIFRLEDAYKVSPMNIHLLSREFPPIGIALGVFTSAPEGETLVGFLMGTATLTPNSLYLTIGGIAPEYNNRNLGLLLFNAMREHAIQKGITSIYEVFEPMEGNLANLYLNKLGQIIIRYETEPLKELPIFRQDEVPTDRVLSHWRLGHPVTLQKLDGGYKKPSLSEAITQYPVLTMNDFPTADRVLLPIPDDYISLKTIDKQSAMQWRLKVRSAMREYINHRGYIATEFYSERGEAGRKNFYLLEKPQGQ